ncbi:MAG: amidohydrolase [Spirochaetae bacterium HGW-Spirochaetae-9]|nr:MAG: amidohydrolase [Spirochaetae bacterium HGW-Spirochaetae-9]
MISDLLIEGATILTIDPEWRIFEPGYIAVKDGRIVALGPAEEGAAIQARRRIDTRGKLLLPGFVNTHTHVPMSAFRGACEDIKDRLTRFLFPLERDLVRPELVYWSTLYCLTEMARSGTTTFADMYYFEDEVAKATKKAGMRALLGETVLGQAAPDAEQPYGGIDYAKDFIAEWKKDGLIDPCFAPHAPYTVDRAHLELLRDEAERLDTDIMIHVAEMDFENRQFSESHGSVLRYLDSIEGLLSSRFLAAHMLYVDDEDVALAAKRGMRVAHCPASNAKSGRLICPAWRLEKAGVLLGLATDGPLSGNGMDMEGVLGLFPKMQKVRESRREIVSAREALRAATLGGAEALHLADRIGSLEAGKRADFILVDMNDFNIQPVYDWYSTVVYAMRPHNVESVFVEGRQIVDARRMTGFDQDEVMREMMKIKGKCSSYIGAIADTLSEG